MTQCDPPSPNPLPTTEGLRAVYDAAIAFRDAEEGTVDLSFKWSALKRALDAAKGVNIAYTPPAKAVAITDAPTTERVTHGWQMHEDMRDMKTGERWGHYVARQSWPVPDGWKLVPIEPDDNMICDGFECDEMGRVTDITMPKCEWPASCAECADLATAVYRAMIAAAPLPPPPGQ